MASPIVIITAVESGFGFLLTSTILFPVLLRGTKTYHYLFAALLFICVIWDLGVFLLMVRNTHVEELEVIGYTIGLPCLFIPALIFHFTCLYTGRPLKWPIILVWGVSAILALLSQAGIIWVIEGAYRYSWGNIYQIAPCVFDPAVLLLWFGINLWACWLLFQGAKRATSRLERRHHLYIGSGFLVITFAIVKVGVVMGIDIPILLPLGMFLVDIFNAIIGIAILKDQLFDITVIVKKGTLYSILAGLLIFLYSLFEHVLVTYIGETVGENSNWVHFVSIAAGIAILMPVKKRLERRMEGFFAQRVLEF